MKIKDIEKNLKKESEQVVVPDVYARVKRAPINRLLSDPVHAFQRKMVNRMLFIAFAIAIVAVIALSAIWLMPTKPGEEEYGYVRVSVGEDAVYVFVVNKAGTVSASITEKSGGADALVRNEDVVGKTVGEAINALYSANPTDEVVVSAQFDNLNTASMIAVQVVGAIDTNGSAAKIESLICDTETKGALVAYLRAHGRAASESYTALELAKRYVSLAGSTLDVGK